MLTAPIHPMDAERATLRARVTVLEAEVARLTEANALLEAQIANADALRVEALDMAEESHTRAASAVVRAAHAERELRYSRKGREAEDRDALMARALRGLR